jgi:glycosyltransferase involved in cell wall biosynthesis
MRKEREMNKKVSVIIPAYNEEKTIRKVITVLQKEKDIIDEIVVIDNASSDKTSSRALSKGVNVYKCEKKGKGYAMETGIMHAKNEILVFLDADINNYAGNLVHKLTAPILNDEADFVKSEFSRNGGRVTTLVVKPLLSILFPDMYKFAQPLSGMIAGKKSDFEKIKLEKDYGVDIGILLDMIQNGARVKEVHIGKINNDSQSWEKLEDMSKEVIYEICIKR